MILKTEDLEKINKVYAKIQKVAIEHEDEETDCKEERKEISMFLWNIGNKIREKGQANISDKKRKEICEKIYKVEHFAMMGQNKKLGLKKEIDLLNNYFEAEDRQRI